MTDESPPPPPPPPPADPKTPVFDDAVVLRTWDWSETSQTCAVFSRSHGVLRGLAKGSKRPKAAFSGGLEILTRGQLGFVHRAHRSSASGSELTTLTEWNLEEIFPALRRHLQSHYAGLYAADVVYHLFQPGDPHSVAFDDLCDFLRGLGHDADLMPALAGLQWRLLVHAGLGPRLHTPPPGAPSPPMAFFPQLGELAPVSDPAPTDRGPVWRVRESTRACLAALARGEPLRNPDPLGAARCARLLASYLRYELEQHLPTLSVVFPDLLPAQPGGIVGEDPPYPTGR